MQKYRLISKKGEGTFSEVLKAQSIKSNKYLAIKCMKSHFESIDQVNNLREIQALRRLSPHPGVIKLYEVLYDQPTGRLALVFELMDMNVYELIRNRRNYLPEARVKHYMYQLVKSMDHMHRNGIFHRDIKPENILVADDVLKVADFGSCRGIYSKPPYTEYISTRWYRAPECLLTDGYYGYKMDMWGVGCVMFEIIALFPLFPGTNELDQIERIHNIVGTPPKEILNKFKKYATHIDFNFAEKAGTGIAKLIPHANEVCVDLIVKLLAYDPEDRLSARQALRHPYFSELRQAEKRAEKEKTSNGVDGKGISSHGKSTEDLHSTGKPKKKPQKQLASHQGNASGMSNSMSGFFSNTDEEPTREIRKKKKNKKGMGLDLVSPNSPKLGGSMLPTISPVHKAPNKATTEDSFQLPSIGSDNHNYSVKKTKHVKDARDYHAHKKTHFTAKRGSNNEPQDSDGESDGYSTRPVKGSFYNSHDDPILSPTAKKKGPFGSPGAGGLSPKKYVSPKASQKGSAMYGRKVGNRLYFEPHDTSSTATKTYKSSYQSPYSQKYIARHRHVS